MEKQSTSKFLRSVIAVVALFMLVVSGVLLASCKEEHVHTEPNDFGACESCGSIIDWNVYESKLSGLLAPSFDDLTASLTDLASEVTEVKGDVDAIVGALNVAGEGSDIDTIVNNVQKVLDQITALIGAENVAARAKPATITGIASAIAGVQQTLDATKAGSIIEHVCDNHVFDTNPITAIAPTCIEKGYSYYRCINCNAIIPSEISANGHEWDTENPVPTTPPTCTEVGAAVYNCKNCDAQSESIEIPANGHTYDWTTPVAEETVDPNCTEDGSATFKCLNCDNTVTLVPSDETTRPVGMTDEDWAAFVEEYEATGHTVDWSTAIEDKKPTCTEDGSATYKCADCDVTFVLTPTDARPEGMTDDQWTAFQADYKATDHTTATEEVWENVKFEQEDEKTQQIVDQVDRVTYEYCTVEGCDYRKEVSRVTENHQLYVDETLTLAEDNSGDIRKVSSLTDEEKTTYGLNEGGINANKVVDGYVNLSCVESGYLYYLCPDECAVKRDNPIKVEIAALGHNLVAGEYVEDEEPTCTEAGKQIWECTYCDYEETRDVKAFGHVKPEEDVEDKAPTCTEDGSRKYICVTCGESVEELYDPETGANKDLAALGHDPQVTETKVVYVDNNMHNVITTYTCTRCPYSYTEGEDGTANEPHKELVFKTEEEAEAAKVKYGYSFDIYQDTKDGMFYFTDASCDDNGVRIYLCECGYWWEDTNFATKYVDKLGHEYGEAVKVEGDCVTGGYSIFVCERCGDSYAVTYDQADGHVWKIVAAVPSDCTTNGNYAYAYCATCGAVIELEDQTLTEADEATLDKFDVDYVEGLNYLTDKAAVEEYFFDEADGHIFDKVIDLRVKGCTDPIWKVTVCSACLESKEGYVFIAKADPEDFTQNEETYVATDLSEMEGLTDEEKAEYIKDIVAGLNYLDNGSFTVEDIVDGNVLKGWNFTGITFKAALGHTLNNFQSVDNEGTLAEGTTAASICVIDANIVSYDKALEYAKVIYPNVDDAAFAVAFDDIFGTNGTNRGTYVIKTDRTAPALAGFCVKCGMPIAFEDHKPNYYMYEVKDANGVYAFDSDNEIDFGTAHVNTDSYLVYTDASETDMTYASAKEIAEKNLKKVTFTIDEIIAMGYAQLNDGKYIANCYFDSFCVNCGHDLPLNANHKACQDPTDYDKYANCEHGSMCIWCDAEMSLISAHNLVDLEEIVKSGETVYVNAANLLYAAGFEWVGKDVGSAADCLSTYENWTVKVCVSCLLSWAESQESGVAGDFQLGWIKDTNYTSTNEVVRGPHDWEKVPVFGENEVNCIKPFAEWYVCSVCGDHLINVQGSANFDETYEATNEFGYILSTLEEAHPHTFAPVANYTDGGDEMYIAPTADHSAYMMFICIECGFRQQGYWGETVLQGDIVLYVMATDEEIEEYRAAGSKYGEVEAAAESDRAPLPEAIEPVPPVSGDDGTEQGGEGGAGAGAGAGAGDGDTTGDGTV